MLYGACLEGDTGAVSSLLRPGAFPGIDISGMDLSGPRFRSPNTKTTPLIAAASDGNVEIVRMLLDRAPNTDVNYADARVATALMMAGQYHHSEVLRVLAERGADVNFTDERRATPLCLAVEPCPSHTNPRQRDPAGDRQLSAVKTLLRLGARPDPIDDEGMTPLTIACKLGHAAVAGALLDAGAKIEYTMPERPPMVPGGHYPTFTPLMFAARFSHAAAVSVLLERGADGTKKTRVSAGDTFVGGSMMAGFGPGSSIMSMMSGFAPGAGSENFMGTRVPGLAAGSTALDIARSRAASGASRGQFNSTSPTAAADTLAVFRAKSCSGCGRTSAKAVGQEVGNTEAAASLKRCAKCPSGPKGARYCGAECQRADWPRHKAGDCGGKK